MEAYLREVVLSAPMLWTAPACLRIQIFYSVLYLFPLMDFSVGCPGN